MQFFAIQLTADENPQNLAELVLRTIEKLDGKCKALELLDTFSLGSTNYTRFRLNFSARVVIDLLESIHDATGRNVIVPGDAKGYFCLMPGGKTGSVPHTTMQVAARYPRVYRGNAILHWERQFLSPV